jgi:pimeloyl-ACP methyl ester carboxylesterase
MGLLTSMRPSKASEAAYFWGPAETFTLAVRLDGRRVASATFLRRFSPNPIRLQRLRLNQVGFIGEYWLPTVSGKRPAILIIGGSNGGEAAGLLGAFLAARGYPSVDVAYFGEPGLPTTLESIPLEYFVKALGWLRAQPHVGQKQVIVLGISRGSEAAFLLAVHYPALVNGVIGSVPDSVALCSYPGCSGPAWTLDGRALPYSHELGDVRPTDDPAAIIPIERVRGPVFLACAGDDQVSPSCLYANAIMKRLDSHQDRYRHVLYRSPNAGHLIGTLFPYEPLASGHNSIDERARETLWPHLMTFLAHIN